MQSITLKYFSPIFQYDRQWAVNMANKNSCKPKNVAVIGLGAVGSQIYINLIRMGLYNWLLIDNDYMLPHNLSKHYLNQSHVGCLKVKALANIGNDILNENNTDYNITNILDYDINELNKKDTIIDFSATIHVPRYLSNNTNIVKRCISAFLSPKGTDSVIIAEDCERKIKLDNLEMQYYRFIAHEPTLIAHLQNDTKGIRYSTSCRDFSSRISQDYVALHAALISNALPGIIGNNNPRIILWHTCGDIISVINHEAPIYTAYESRYGIWTIKYDQGLIDKVYSIRKKKLPNETGGVLLGSYDMLRKILYVVDTTSSPPDSEEWPKSYIRGCKGLKKEVDSIRDITQRNLDYIGEWHSHPKGSSSLRSGTDEIALSILASTLEISGVPALMMIAGDNNDFSFYLLDKTAQ